MNRLALLALAAATLLAAPGCGIAFGLVDRSIETAFGAVDAAVDVIRPDEEIHLHVHQSGRRCGERTCVVIIDD